MNKVRLCLGFLVLAARILYRAPKAIKKWAAAGEVCERLWSGAAHLFWLCSSGSWGFYCILQIFFDSDFDLSDPVMFSVVLDPNEHFKVVSYKVVIYILPLLVAHRVSRPCGGLSERANLYSIRLAVRSDQAASGVSSSCFRNFAGDSWLIVELTVCIWLQRLYASDPVAAYNSSSSDSCLFTSHSESSKGAKDRAVLICFER